MPEECTVIQQRAFSQLSIMRTLMCDERKFWKEFINLYKKCPALWDAKSEQYKNKEYKDLCYKVLLKKLKTIDPNADHSTVRKKINILRTNFRREFNRVSSSNVNPTLWYFEDIMFTLGSEDVRKGAAVSTCTSETASNHDVKISNDIETQSNNFENGKNTESNNKEAKEIDCESERKIDILKGQKKSDAKCVNDVKREFWRNFIQMYESFPALWKTNSPEYKDRRLKEECYHVLVNNLKQIEPDADRATVRKKINTLRCNFRREQNRIRRLQCSSKLWYYDYMMFITKHENDTSDKDESACDSADDLDIKPEMENSVNQNDFPIPEVVETFRGQMEEMDCKSEIDTISDHSVATTLDTLETTSRMFDKVTKMSDDEIDLQGKIWAAEFRKLNAEQQLFAKKAIDDILFERRLAGIVQSQNK